MTDTIPPTPVYAEIDRDDLGEATSGFAQAVEDIAHHEIGDGWDFYDPNDIPGEMNRLEHRLDQMSEMIKQSREILLRLRMIGAVRAMWASTLEREGIPVEADGVWVEEDLYSLTFDFAQLYATGVPAQEARAHPRLNHWLFTLIERVATDDGEEEYERLEPVAERVLAEAVTAAWAAATPPPDPHRLVDLHARSWLREKDGYRWRWGDVPRTRGELEATGARPVGPAPREEVESVRRALDALDPDRIEATARAALHYAWNKLNERYLSWGGSRRLVAGRPGCWEAEQLAEWAEEPVRPEADQEVAATVADTLISWVTRRQVAYPEDIHAALTTLPPSEDETE